MNLPARTTTSNLVKPDPIVAVVLGIGLTERQYARAIQKYERKAGHMKKLPHRMPDGGQDISTGDITEAILKVAKTGMNTNQIAKAVTDVIGRRVWNQTINDRLTGPLSDRFKIGHRTNRGIVWARVKTKRS